MESDEVFPCFEKITEGASIIESPWVMGSQLLANGTIDTWKLHPVSHGSRRKKVRRYLGVRAVRQRRCRRSCNMKMRRCGHTQMKRRDGGGIIS